MLNLNNKVIKWNKVVLRRHQPRWITAVWTKWFKMRITREEAIIKAVDATINLKIRLRLRIQPNWELISPKWKGESRDSEKGRRKMVTRMRLMRQQRGCKMDKKGESRDWRKNWSGLNIKRHQFQSRRAQRLFQIAFISTELITSAPKTLLNILAGSQMKNRLWMGSKNWRLFG